MLLVTCYGVLAIQDYILSLPRCICETLLHGFSHSRSHMGGGNEASRDLVSGELAQIQVLLLAYLLTQFY